MHVLALLLFAQGAGLPADPALDVRTDAILRAHRLPVQLKELGRQWGVPMRCAPELEGRYLLLHVTDRPKRDVMLKISDAVGGRWVKSPYAYELLPKDRSEDLAKRAGAIAEAQKKLREELDSQPMNEATLRPLVAKQLAFQAELEQEDTGSMGDEVNPLLEEEEAESDFEVDPAVRLAMRLLISLDPRELASLGQRKRTVFSSDPAESQRPLGESLNEAYALFEQETSLVARVARPFLPTLPEKVRAEAEARLRPRRTRKVLLVVLPDIGQHGVVGGVAALYGDDGKRWIEGWGMIGDFEEPSLPGRSLRDQMTGDDSEPIPFGPVAAHVLRGIVQRRSGAVPQPAGEDLVRLITDPADHPRLSFGYTDAAFKLAEVDNLDVVLCPSPFTPLPEVRLATQVPPRVGSFRALVESQRELHRPVSEQGWWMLEDVDPLLEFQEDPEAEAAYMQAFLEERLGFWEVVGLDARADFLAYLGALDVRLAGLAAVDYGMGGELARILRDLDGGQQAELMEVGHVRIRLTDEQRRRIQESDEMGGAAEDLRMEVTEYPLEEAVLRLKRSPTYWALPADANHPRDLRPIDPFVLALSHMAASDPEMAVRFPKRDRYLLVSGTDWEVSMDLGMGKPMQGSVRTVETIGDEPIPIEQFPKEFCDQFKKELEEMKKEMEDEDGGGQ